MRRQAEILQSMWSKAGIRLALQPMDKAAARAKVKAGEFEMHMADYAPSPDPAYYSRVLTCDGSANWQNYCNKEVDKCFAEGVLELDAQKRAEIYQRCHKLMYEDALVGGTYISGAVVSWRKELKGFTMLVDTPDLQDAWLDK